MTQTMTARRRRSKTPPRRPKKPAPVPARLAPDGSVRIPRRLLSKAKLKPGDAVEFEVRRGELVVHPAAPPGMVWEQGMLVVDGTPSQAFLKELQRIKQEDLDREMRKCWPT
jgi:antitoxin component of MazEF toxin-antitoxin module